MLCFAETLMSTCADLELCIHRQADGSYTADLRLQTPDNAVAAELATRQPVPLDFARLQQVSLDPSAYGRELMGMVFAEETMRRGWFQARAYANGKELPLRVCLNPGLSDELHALRWENLYDPQYQAPLALSEQVIFSRILASPDLTPVVIPLRPQLCALIVVANPTDLAAYSLAPIGVAEEIARITNALGSIPATIIGDSPDAVQPRATLPAIIEQLRPTLEAGSAGPHILYLVCHGTLVDGEPYLWLERADGSSERTRGRDLVARVRDLARRPLLAVLASCQSAGQGYGDVLAALGPQLAQAGIPAVLAMQGNVPMQTVEHMMPVFFRELQRDGQVDRALAAARGAVQRDPNWWMPVLFLRVRDGRLWREEQADAAPPAVRSTSTGGGDYAEGNIDKRQGIFAHEVHIHGPLPPPPPPEPDAEQVLLAYLKRLRIELAKTDVVPIANAYAAANTRDYVPLQVSSPQNTPPEPVFAALAAAFAEQRPAGLLLIGDAGSGKSHTLRYAALALAQAWPGMARELQADLGLVIDKPLLPVYVQLQDLPRCRAELRQAEPKAEPTLLQLIDHHLCRLAGDADRWPAGLIRTLVTTAAQPCLFLLDGLDEIDGSQERRDFQEALLRLQREHQEHVYVVTSRPLPDLSLGAPNFVARNLLDLQPEQMRHILLHWCRAEYGAAPLAPEVERQVERQADDLLSAILRDQDLAPMAPNPLFLTAMARMAMSSVGLPRLKVRKYSQMVDLLLDWRRNRIRLDDRASLFADLRHRSALGHLARFAACMLTLKQRSLSVEAFVHGACVQALPPPTDEDPLDADAVEQLLRSVARHTGLLVEHSGRRYSFTLGFGDYLAACAHARFGDVVARLFEHHADPAWRATIVMTVGYMVDEAAFNPRRLRPLLERLLSSGPEATLLAAEALCETIDQQPADEPGHYVRTPFVSELAREGRQVLARLRAMKADPALIRRLEPFEEGGV